MGLQRTPLHQEGKGNSVADIAIIPCYASTSDEIYEKIDQFMETCNSIYLKSVKNIGIRADSKFTAPEPELAVVLGKKGAIVGYTLANDVSAWDIERENALYLPQSKVYTACCSLGPVMVTADEIKDPYNLHMTCEILRDGVVRFSGSTSTGKLHRKIETIVEYLVRSNPVPAGSVLCTGTGIIVTEEVALAPGDVVRIHVEEIGELINTCAIV